MAGSFAFEQFVLDPEDRRLRRGNEAVELNGRYFDALSLLVRERGKLVSKDRFLDEVWRGVPVTDEALTQCVRTLRRQLGDDAARPRFIETVPKYGYRFIAPVDCVGAEGAPAIRSPASTPSWNRTLLLGLAGTIGGGLAGLVGGLIYGFLGASQPLQPGMGAASVLLVLLCVTILVSLIGGAGVSFGIALADRSRRLGPWSVAGGAAGGLFVGATVKLLGLDAFSLLVGQSPGDITGAFEGLVVGAGVGSGAWLASRASLLRSGVVVAALTGALAGVAVALLGGRLMLGSLDLLARQMPGSRLRLDQISRIFGEPSFGPVTRTVTSALEGALFAAGVAGAMLFARRNLASASRPSGVDQ
jgi:DNA-binding winged helix-turn-helix (wHTH) protein